MRAVDAATSLPAPVSFELSVGDLGAFAEWQRKRPKSPWSSAVGLLALIAFAVLVGLAVSTNLPVGVGAAVILVGAFVVASRLGKRRQQRTMSRHALLASGTLAVDEPHVRFDSTFGASTYGWDYFNDVVDTGDHVFLMGCRTCCIIVPRRAFLNREAKGAFVDFFEAHLRGAKR